MKKKKKTQKGCATSYANIRNNAFPIVSVELGWKVDIDALFKTLDAVFTYFYWNCNKMLNLSQYIENQSLLMMNQS